MLSNQTLYQYLVTKTNLSMQEVISQYSQYCYFSYQKTIDFKNYQKELQDKMLLIDVNNINTAITEYQKINQDTKAKINEVEKTISNYNQLQTKITQFFQEIKVFDTPEAENIKTVIQKSQDNITNTINTNRNTIDELRSITNNNVNLIMGQNDKLQEYKKLNELYGTIPEEYTINKDDKEIIIWNITDIEKPTRKTLQTIYNDYLLEQQNIQLLEKYERKKNEIVNFYNANKRCCSIGGIMIKEKIDDIIAIIDSKLELPRDGYYMIMLETISKTLKIPVSHKALLQDFSAYLKTLLTNKAKDDYNYENYVIPLQQLYTLYIDKKDFDIINFEYKIQLFDITQYFSNKNINISNFLA